MDKFTYLGSSISSTENDLNMRLAKALTVIDKLWFIWESELSDGCSTWMLTKHREKKLAATYHSFQKPSKLDEQDIQETPGEVRMNSRAMFFYGPLHTDEQVFGDQLELIYNSSVWKQDVAWETFLR